MHLYNISYKDPISGNICSRVPALACQDDGVCSHTFEVSSSLCNPSTNISVTVTATSMFGAGEKSEPLTIGMTIVQFTDQECVDMHVHVLMHSCYNNNIIILCACMINFLL